MLLTVREVAEQLKVNRNFVYSEIKRGELKALKIGSIKIKKTDLEAYIEAKRGWCNERWNTFRFNWFEIW